MYKTAIIKVNTDFDMKEHKGKFIKFISAETINNKSFVYLVKIEKRVESVLCHLKENDKIEIGNSIKAVEHSKIKLLGDLSSNCEDKVVITYEVVGDEQNNNIKANVTNKSIFDVDDEEEDEEYDENGEEELNEEDSNVDEESDMNDIVNDLWNDFENDLDENEKEQFLGKKRQN
jgi:hypothetical protein